MALDITDLLTVMGKYVKTINTWNGYLTALSTAKGDIFTVLEAENLEDLYVDIPSQFTGFQDAVASWISSLIGEVEDILTDETYVLENLPISASDVTTVLNAIFDQMIEDADTIKSSVVSLGGLDQDEYYFIPSADAASTSSGPRVFVTRTLDGVNDPSSLVSAHTSYNNVESQLAKTANVYAKVISSAEGSEVLQLFASSPFQESYTNDTESPGVGPTITNIESSNIIATNYDFSSWSGDNPTGWTLAGGTAGTAWEDQLSLGTGPLRINTAGVTLKQQLTLERRTMYVVAAHVQTIAASPGNLTDWKLRIENVDGATVHKSYGTVVIPATDLDSNDLYSYVYGFYSPSDTVNLDDIYFCLEFDAEDAAGDYGKVYRVAVAPATYYNGLGFAFWNPYAENTSAYTYSPLLVNDYGSIAVSNSNGGVFQTFFRKAFNIQLPTADSPTIADSLAT
jgi:hypothetical protein